MMKTLSNTFWIHLCDNGACIDFPAKSECPEDASRIFGSLLDGTIVAWNSFIAGYDQNRNHKETSHCLDWIQIRGSMPDMVTPTFFLRVCVSLYDIEKGTKIHAQIVRNGLLGNEVSVGNALIDIYADCGWFIAKNGNS